MAGDTTSGAPPSEIVPSFAAMQGRDASPSPAMGRGAPEHLPTLEQLDACFTEVATWTAERLGHLEAQIEALRAELKRRDGLDLAVRLGRGAV